MEGSLDEDSTEDDVDPVVPLPGYVMENLHQLCPESVMESVRDVVVADPSYRIRTSGVDITDLSLQVILDVPFTQFYSKKTINIKYLVSFSISSYIF